MSRDCYTLVKTGQKPKLVPGTSCSVCRGLLPETSVALDDPFCSVECARSASGLPLIGDGKAEKDERPAPLTRRQREALARDRLARLRIERELGEDTLERVGGNRAFRSLEPLSLAPETLLLAAVVRKERDDPKAVWRAWAEAQFEEAKRLAAEEVVA